MKIKHPLLYFLFLMLMLWFGSCNSITTVTSVATNSYLMDKQEQAIAELYKHTGYSLETVPIYYDASMHDKIIAQEIMIGATPGIRINSKYQWADVDLEYIILHELGHINGLSHGLGIMAYYIEGFGQMYEDNKEWLLKLYVDQLDRHNQGATQASQ